MMTSARIVTFHHPDFLFCCRNNPLIFTWPSTKSCHQMNFKMVTHCSLSQVLGGSRQASGSYNRHINRATTRGNQYQGVSSDSEYDQIPFWLTMISDIARVLRSLAHFLIEQPSQLKYIEWPTFESTVRTASLTLVLVALLIVSLATVDSFLFYILAFLSRKSA